ncbi:hypothetical protein RRG08_015643 [Elysia crispata]|uniref:Uncharacterized protein n=1 Tax=Elysia crispata TaxID=231223 RepID=A0AAE0Y8W3_9GAST|nr:hypothetical protein RRG08_015643 [Elysia crispata]
MADVIAGLGAPGSRGETEPSCHGGAIQGVLRNTQRWISHRCEFKLGRFTLSFKREQASFRVPVLLLAPSDAI